MSHTFYDADQRQWLGPPIAQPQLNKCLGQILIDALESNGDTVLQVRTLRHHSTLTMQ